MIVWRRLFQFVLLVGCNQRVDPTLVSMANSVVDEEAKETVIHHESFPPLDIRCAEDSDCAAHLWYLTDDGRCCSSCTYQIGSFSWTEQIRKVCETKSHEGCPMKKCVAPPAVKCMEEICVAAK